ncbi:MAG: D-glycero-beta-D-manno-heptose-7-phosphate kinase [Pseudomonadota bacterium]|nr:D-glycero-beta-D-manno-heptose-7-phosphate kinase [Pseudomonadota bacterium]
MNDITSLIACLRRLSAGNVLCIGDVMLDRFVYGDVERISPEAPIPVFNTESEKRMLGGAGNVAQNISGLGGKTYFVSVIGDDDAGKDITNQVKSIKGLEANLVTDTERKTSIKTRFIASGQQMMRADEETTQSISKQISEKILKASTLGMKHSKAMVLADYGKGVLTDGLASALINMARRKNIPVVVDPQGKYYRAYTGANLITPNRRELAEASDLPTTTTEEVVRAASHILKTTGIESVLATRSSDGMTLINRIDSFKHFQAEAKEVFDVSGAGDTVVACISLAISAGVSMENSIALANAAAGIVVGKVGTAVAYARDLERALDNKLTVTSNRKILALGPLLEEAEMWVSEGKLIGFTNGCFDLLHPGHIATLNEAKNFCDKLVVGVNSDKSIRELKGNSRPIQDETVRSQILAALEVVDAVIIFDEKTPADMIKKIEPNIYVKGGDYTIDQVPEAEVVKGYGGKVVLAKFQKGYSTTNTIKRITN